MEWGGRGSSRVLQRDEAVQFVGELTVIPRLYNSKQLTHESEFATLPLGVSVTILRGAGVRHRAVQTYPLL